MNGVVPTQPIATKATRLLDQHRVYLSRTSPIARVQGDTGRYTIEATHSGVRCTCQAGANLDRCHRPALVGHLAAGGNP